MRPRTAGQLPCGSRLPAPTSRQRCSAPALSPTPPAAQPRPLLLHSTSGTRSAAPEQYCDAADYFRGQHAACFKAVQQAYRRDVDRLRYGAAAAAAAGAAADDEDNE